jgi:hypothetical protein
VRVLHRASRGLLDAETISNFVYFRLTTVGRLGEGSFRKGIFVEIIFVYP